MLVNNKLEFIQIYDNIQGLFNEFISEGFWGFGVLGFGLGFAVRVYG